MDRLGMGILRQLLVDESTLTLQADVRRPYRDIARKLGVTEDTVRNRVQRMQDVGLIRGWRLGLNPTLMDCQMEFLSFDVSPRVDKECMISTAETLKGVIGVQNFVGDGIGVTVVYSKREELDDVITKLRGKANPRSVFATKLPFFPCRMTLTDMDWRVVGSIQGDPRKPLSQVATELGISRRTVKRRVQRMLNGHAFWLIPELNLGKLDGLLAHLSVVYPPGFKTAIDRQIFRKYGASMVMGHSTQSEYSWFALVVPNFGVVREIESWTARLKGVTFAQVSVAVEIIYPSAGAFGGMLRNRPILMTEARTEEKNSFCACDDELRLES